MNLIEVSCTQCGRTTAQAPEWTKPALCLDCGRRAAGLDDNLWFTPIGPWHPTIARVLPDPERVRAYAEAHAAPPEPAYVVLRAAQPYDLTTPGTPDGLRQLARAAAEGGIFAARATFALAVSPDGVDVVASLALRLSADGPEDDRRRRAWVVYVRRGDRPWSATSTAAGGGTALLDTQAGAVPMRTLGVLELKAILLGRTYVPPPPRPGPPRMRCYTCDKVTPFSTSTWRPYTRHRCETNQEGRS